MLEVCLGEDVNEGREQGEVLEGKRIMTIRTNRDVHSVSGIDFRKLNLNYLFMERFFRFTRELHLTEKPDWQSENVVVYETNAFKLRQFTPVGSGSPLLILPPQAGHHSCIADYALPDQSLVALCGQHTDCTIYAVEWKSADISRRHETIDDLVKQVRQCIQFIGCSIHVIGLCQAGWLASIYAAIFPDDILSLILGGAPIDFTAGGGKIQEMVQSLPFAFYASLVQMGRGVMKGRFIVDGFKNMHAYDRYIGDYMKLYGNLDNPVAVQRSRKFRTWYEYTQDLAGAWYLQAVYELFKRNRLVRGKLKVMGKYVRLEKITCPVVLVAGENDDITLEPQLFNMEKYVSGPVWKIMIPKCGHIGLFMKKDALENYWTHALDYVLLRREKTAVAM
jgi:poly(3-hydroxyalkanoate) synthetase